MAFDFSELEAYYKNWRKFSGLWAAWLHNFLLQEGARVVAEAKLNSPVDTGLLRESWRVDGIEKNGSTLTVYFINPVYYALT